MPKERMSIDKLAKLMVLPEDKRKAIVELVNQEVADNTDYFQREFCRMNRVLEEMGQWDQFCAKYAEMFPFAKIPSRANQAELGSEGTG